MNKTIVYNGASVIVDWSSSVLRKKVESIFTRAGKECDAIAADRSIEDGSIEEAEKVEAVYRNAFSELFGVQKCDALFPEDTGLASYMEFIDLMLKLKDEQDKAVESSTQRFASIVNMAK